MTFSTTKLGLAMCAALVFVPGCGEGQTTAPSAGTSDATKADVVSLPATGAKGSSPAPAIPSSAVECVIQGEQAFQDGDRAGALALYDQAIQKTADNPPQMKHFVDRRAQIASAAK